MPIALVLLPLVLLLLLDVLVGIFSFGYGLLSGLVGLVRPHHFRGHSHA